MLGFFLLKILTTFICHYSDDVFCGIIIILVKSENLKTAKKTRQKHKFAIHARILANHVLPTTLLTCIRCTQHQDTHRFVR